MDQKPEEVKVPGRYRPLLKRKTLIPLIAGVIGLFFLASFLKDNIACVGGFPVFKSKKAEVPGRTLEQPPTPIKAYKVARVNFRDTLPSLGTIKGFREIELKFPVGGVLEYINFKEGERIAQGDIIASLDQKEALLKLEYAKIEAEKHAKLYELGSILESKYRQSQLEFQSAKVELERTNLVALSDGYIGSIEVDKGSVVTPQDKIGIFVDMKDVYIEFGIIEKDVAKIKEGQNVEITLDSYPDQIFKGVVDSVSPLVEGRSRTVKIRSRIANPDEKIKPGMFGRVNVLVYEKEQALVIPSSSFKKKDDQYFVYLVHAEESAPEAAIQMPGDEGAAGDGGPKGAAPEIEAQRLGTVEVRTIDIQYATPDAIEIKEGLEEGDLVIVDVDQELQEKSKVEITEIQEGIF